MADSDMDLRPEAWQQLSDDRPERIEMAYEGNRVPFFVILLWVFGMIGVVIYLAIHAYPDAVDWLG